MDLPNNTYRRNRTAVISALLLAAALPGARAQVAKYCEGNLALNSLYSTVQSSGNSSTVNYVAELQNRSGQAQHFSVRFTAPNALQAQNGSTISILGSYQTKTMALGKRQFNNPAARGAPTAMDMLKFVEVNCRR